jgi:competence protein ComEC
MSFAATVALIAGFREVDRRVSAGRMPRLFMPVFTLVLSSVIGGFATAPYAAAHFNRFTDYGLIANLLTVPVMGAVVMPAGAVAALLAPLGLAALPLWVMERGSAWILMIAHWVAGWEGSVTPIPAPAAGSLGLITLGGLWLILWRGWGRVAGFVPILAALVMWAHASRPAVLISGDAALVGVMGPEGRVLSARKGAGFAARNWLENDGDLARQEAAAARPGMTGAEGRRAFDLAGVRGIALKGRGAQDDLAMSCAEADVVIIPAQIDAPPDGCLVLDQRLLRQTGPLALYPVEGGLRVEATRSVRRAWSPPPMPGGLPQVIRPAARMVAETGLPGQ